ncbi:unnamed protein product [Thlaspi arvense]|uniref:DNA-directed RNA polymerase I subunit rpa49 n=1 Tax=Thlaspi arvense TaxID=13288 RepID=A0AAU9RZ85_THLAR|nr:unnamed protein product [Thlaspi arvense]
MADENQNDHMDEEDGFKTPVPEKKRQKTKKIAIEKGDHDEDATIDISVNQISEKPDRIPPVVAYFASGYDPSAQSAGGKSPEVTVYRHTEKSKRRLQVVVSPPGSSVEFVGSNYTGEQTARQTCVYSLGVLDKETQTLKILPIAYNKIYRLEPRVKKFESEASESEVIPQELNEDEQREELNKSFGTKKAINDEKKRRARNLGDGAEALDGRLDKIDVNATALESTSAIVARNIPPHNASATTPGDAYPIEKIIDNGEWDFLQDVYKLQAGAPTDAYPVFVRNRLHMLRDIRDETEKQTVSCVLSLLTHLVKFKDINSMDGFDSAKNHKFPAIIRQKCKSLFKDSDADRMPADKINLLISYVLVLSLHVDKFKTDPEDIAADLRISPVGLRRHFDALGCKFAREKKIFLATLPVPLKFPETSMRRKRR